MQEGIQGKINMFIFTFALDSIAFSGKNFNGK